MDFGMDESGNSNLFGINSYQMIFNDDSNIPTKWYLLASEDNIEWETIEYRDTTTSSLLSSQIYYNVVYSMNVSYNLQGDVSPDDVNTSFYLLDNSFNSVKEFTTNRDVPQFKCFRFVFTLSLIHI